MLVFSIPIKTFEMNKDGKGINHNIYNLQNPKVHCKKPIRNYNYMKMVINHKSREVRNTTISNHDHLSRTTSVETSKTNLLQFSRDARDKNFEGPNKRKHHRKFSSQTETEKKRFQILPDFTKGFPEGKVKKSKDPKWYSYCASALEKTRAKGCIHGRQSSFSENGRRYQSSQKPKTAPQQQPDVQTINLQNLKGDMGKQIYFKTLQYKSARISMSTKRKEGNKMGSLALVTPDISPWAISLQNLQNQG